MPHLLYTGPSPDGIHADEAAALCLRRRGFEREMGARDVEARARGTLVHVGLAHYYQRMMEKQEGRDPTAYYAPEDAAQLVADQGSVVYSRVLPVVLAFLQEYPKLVKLKDYGLRILGVEILASVELPGWDALGLPPKTLRVDVVGLQQGQIKIIDHKSTGYANGKEQAWAYARTWQFHLLAWLARQVTQRQGVSASPVLNLCQVGDQPKVLRPSLDLAPGRLASLPMSLAWHRMTRAFWEASGLPAREWPATASESTCRGRYSRCDYAAECDSAFPESVTGSDQLQGALRHLRSFVG